MKHIVALLFLGVVASTQASASGIVYRGMNPEITPTANPYNETAISNFANLTRPAAKTSTSNNTTEAQLLKDSVISGLSATYQQLLTSNTSTSGRVNFGDGSYASYTTSGSTRYITFYDLNGRATEISFPLN